MRAEFTMAPFMVDVTMNFTYSFTDDPLNEQLIGNITWVVPNPAVPSHWTHSEDTCLYFFGPSSVTSVQIKFCRT